MIDNRYRRRLKHARILGDRSRERTRVVNVRPSSLGPQRARNISVSVCSTRTRARFSISPTRKTLPVENRPGPVHRSRIVRHVRWPDNGILSRTWTVMEHVRHRNDDAAFISATSWNVYNAYANRLVARSRHNTRAIHYVRTIILLWEGNVTRPLCAIVCP